MDIRRALRSPESSQASLQPPRSRSSVPFSPRGPFSTGCGRRGMPWQGWSPPLRRISADSSRRTPGFRCRAPMAITRPFRAQPGARRRFPSSPSAGPGHAFAANSAQGPAPGYSGSLPPGCGFIPFGDSAPAISRLSKNLVVSPTRRPRGRARRRRPRRTARRPFPRRVSFRPPQG